MPRFEKGKSGNPAGKPKGAVNKTTAVVRDAILQVFDQEAFAAWAKANPGLFYTQILTRILPREMRIEGDKTLEITVRDCTKDAGGTT